MFLVLPVVGGGGYGSPQTVFSQTLNTDSGGGYGDYSIRHVITSVAYGGDQIRVTFEAPSAASLYIDNASVGILAGGGNAWDTTATPVELLFSGGSGVTITAGNTATSDWTTFSFADTDDLVVIHDLGSSSSTRRRDTTPSGISGYNKSATDSYNQATPSGFTSGIVTAITIVEARSAT